MSERNIVEILVPGIRSERSAFRVVEVYKQRGDEVERGELLCTVAGDGVALDVQSPYSGQLVTWLVEEGDVAEAHAPVAQLIERIVPVTSEDAPTREPIAVVGMAFRFPGSVNDPDSFWTLLRDGGDAIRKRRFPWLPVGDSSPTAEYWGGYIDDIDRFDAGFFRLSPREAELMDPQHRLFLETAWHALEDAGIRPGRLAGSKTGVYAGVCNYDYGELQQAHPSLAHSAYSSLGTAPALLTNRLSFLLDLRGPSQTIDTASSSSLVALHHAVQGLRQGACDLALAGGVNLFISSRIFDAFADAGMLGRDGRCRTFDARADGYVRGEGVAVVALKTLTRAQADGDRIHGVIRHTVQNHGGKAQSMTSPNRAAQTELLVSAYQQAEIPIESVSYFEAHGTGTPVGDPIEAAALQCAFQQLCRDPAGAGSRHRSGLGSVKSNIGHLEAAAGLSGLIKVLVCLQRRQLAPLVHFQRLNPDISLDDSPFYIVDALQPWEPAKDDDGVPWPRRAGLSSFGFGGANAHAIIEEYVEPDANGSTRSSLTRPQALVLSAQTPEQLEQVIGALRTLVAGVSLTADHLEALACMSQLGRESMRERIAFLVDGPEDVQPILAQEPLSSAKILRGRVTRSRAEADDSRVDASAHDLARRWIDGNDVDWAVLYRDGRPTRTSFPRYPFARERHWFLDGEVVTEAQEPRTPAAPASRAEDLFYGVKRWTDASLDVTAKASDGLSHLVLASPAAGLEQAITRAFPTCKLLSLSAPESDGEGDSDRFVRGAVRLFQLVRACLEADPGATESILILVSGDERSSFAHAPLLALLKSAHRENPRLRSRLVIVPRETSSERVLSIIAQETPGDHGQPAEIRYLTDGKRQQRTIQEIPGSDIVGARGPSIKHGGVYWITGGMGGLGQIVARHIAGFTGTTLVLTGRSRLDDARRTELETLRRDGAAVEYIAGDIAALAEAQRIADTILDRYGRIDGVIHAAGVLRDGFLLRKSEEEFRAVLAPKVGGVVNLDLATRSAALDFFVVFSSFTSVLGNPGQAGYATANAFLDGYAEYRRRLVDQGARAGKTVSINWPLWLEGGMGANEPVREALRHWLGMAPMSTETGLDVFDRALGGAENQLLVIEGDIDKIRSQIRGPLLTDSSRGTDEVRGDVKELRGAVIATLEELLEGATKIPRSKIDETEFLEMYGIDSIIIGQLNRVFDDALGDHLIPKTLFYEYRTLAEVADYFVREHHDATLAWMSAQNGGAPGDAHDASADPEGSASSRRERPATSVAHRDDGHERYGPIALIGLSGRYPGAQHVRELWPLLRDGNEATRVVPADRWNVEEHFIADKEEAVRRGVSYSRWGGFIDGFDEFDCLLFNISPREAVNIDPQERKFLECCWEVLEDAGYTREALRDHRVGVFAGITKTGFALHRSPERGARGVMPRTSFSSVANRVSYAFDFHGPSMPVDTMCSASLTAIHLACEHIRSGECDLAIAGGVNLYLHPDNYAYLCRMRMLSDDGKNRSFGRGGNGFVPGEGVGAVLLKRLDRAEADGDIIHAVIRGSAVNHGGRTAGYTVPNPNAQRDLVVAALARAAVDARTISYIEAHGTGTELGDPIEIAGLSHAFQRDTRQEGFCAIGSVKSNIGHLEAAAGIAGVAKVVLQFAHRALAPSLHTEELNPNIHFERTPFYVQRGLETWERPVIDGEEIPRRAGISSFGAGGSNAHVVLEEYRPAALLSRCEQDCSAEPVLIVLSAKTEDSLRAYARRLAAYFDSGSTWIGADGRPPRLVDIAYTLMIGREAMEHRAALVATDASALASALESLAAGHPPEGEVFRGAVEPRSAGAVAPPAVVDSWLAYHRLAELGEHWCAGGTVEWRALYRASDARRISLPTYAFSRRRVWFEHEAAEPRREDRPAVTAERENDAASRPRDGRGERRGVRLSRLDQPVMTPTAVRAPVKIKLTELDDQPEEDDVASSDEESPAVRPIPLSRAGGHTNQETQTGVRAKLRRQLAGLLFLSEDEIGAHDRFVDLGLDSIIGVEWVKMIGREIGRRVAATTLYDHPTLTDLAAFLVESRSGEAEEPQAALPAPQLVAREQALPAPQLVARKQDEIERVLEQQLAELLFLEPTEVHEHDRFVDLGLDSILGVEWIKAINRRFELSLPATKLYDHPTIVDLGRFIASKLATREERPVDEAPTRAPALVVEAVATAAPELSLPVRGVDAKLSASASLAGKVAVVGMSGRFPGARDINRFWKNLAAGVHSVVEIPRERWDADAYFDPTSRGDGRVYAKWLGALDGIDEFDPLFFNLSPSEAEFMDPQQRLFLQEAWRAFEDAGYSRESLDGVRCGTYVGMMLNDYWHVLSRDRRRLGTAQTMLGNSNAIAAARIAYLLNLEGPALAVDTACSSSLVAAHQAHRALLVGDVDVALIGGVTLYLVPDVYMQMCEAGMLSHRGRCFSFDHRADGIVPGEAVAALICKRLEDAVAAGDHIYGVIVGSGINQDGKTNGITAPSVNSQIELERRVYRRAGISPRTVSYIEAHGTGTRLGDPIEWEALTEVYREHATRPRSCAIGSVKSNIGHTAAAAGLVGLQKVLLSLDRGQLPPSINFERGNPHIDFEDSPFHVNTSLKDWPRSGDQPRRAAINSFGFSGTNAHMVVEEYIDRARPGVRRRSAAPGSPEPDVILPLSARTADRLPVMAARLRAHLDDVEQLALRDVAYTLQVGRQAMEHRVAFIARDVAEFCAQLDAFATGQPPEGRVFLGQAGKERDFVEYFHADEDLRDVFSRWVAKGKLAPLAGLWVEGLELDWAALYPRALGERISLPTYPFATGRYWPAGVKDTLQGHRLHPLVHENISVFGEQRFSTRFHGEEWLLRDHRVAGRSVLAGVAQLEMVRAGVMLSGRSGRISFEHVLWAEPLVIDGAGRTVIVTLDADGDRIRYQIKSTGDGDPGEERVHGRGRLRLSSASSASAPVLDVAQRFEQMDAGRSRDTLYREFAARGMEYGPGFRCVEELRVGPDEVVARLSLSSCQGGSPGPFVLHPGILDAALQATIGLAPTDQVAPTGESYLPFSAQAVEVFSATPGEGYALVRPVVAAGEGAVRRFDIDLVDRSGVVCVRFRSLALHTAAASKRRTIGPSTPPADAIPALVDPGEGIVYATTRWRPSAPRPESTSTGGPAALVVLVGLPPGLTRAVRGALPAEIREVSPGELDSPAERAFAAFAAVLAIVKDAIRRPENQPKRMIAVIPGGLREYWAAALAGLLKTVKVESAKLEATLVTLDECATWTPERLESVVRRELAAAPDVEVLYDESGARHTRQLDELSVVSGLAPAYRPGGVYWISGGLGGLGVLVARHLCAATPVTVILSGRSSLTPEKRALLADLQRPERHVEYIQVDCADRRQVARAHAAVRDVHGRLDGVIHSAGVLRDSLIVNKTDAEAREVFRAKVDAVVNLDEVTRQDSLEFFAVFSSLASILGNLGQSDYAAANSFLDAFADHRNGLVERGERSGWTTAIAWPLWRDGGMRIDAVAEQRLARTRGMHSLPTDAGLRAFDFAIAQRQHEQVIVLAGDRARLRALLGTTASSSTGEEDRAPSYQGDTPQGAAPDTVVDEAEVRSEIVRVLCDLLKLQPADIEFDTDLAEYGIDSISMMKVLDRLERIYDAPVDPLAIVDHPNVIALARFLIHEGIARPTATRSPTPQASLTAVARPGPELYPPRQQGSDTVSAASFSSAIPSAHDRSARSDRVAIVSMSCRLPRSPTPETFWDNLASGRDLITDVPPQRWPAQAVFCPDRTERDKTYTNRAGFLDDIAGFDASFFGLREDDALALDPQQRIVLELTQELFDRAGYDRRELAGSDTSVFLGAKENSYIRNNYHLLPRSTLKRAIVNTIGNMIASRVSDFYDLKGPSKSIDTACSSSLVAVHDACQGLLSREFDAAIAGGIFLLVDPFAHIGFSQAEVLSDDGRSYVFDERAKGFVLGEGAALVLLKRYDDAVRDGDAILGVVRGSAVNNDGKTMGLTVPSLDGQKAVIERALRRSEIDPGDITNYEAHGTGTLLGDPIEVKASTEVYREYTDRRQYCAIGSVKSNLGHTMTAAGVVSLVKVLLSLQHGKIPATLHCARPHPRFRFEESPFFPALELRDWQPNGRSRLAAISSFGFGGTNCHMILEGER